MITIVFSMTISMMMIIQDDHNCDHHDYNYDVDHYHDHYFDHYDYYYDDDHYDDHYCDHYGYYYDDDHLG